MLKLIDCNGRIIERQKDASLQELVEYYFDHTDYEDQGAFVVFDEFGVAYIADVNIDDGRVVILQNQHGEGFDFSDPNCFFVVQEYELSDEDGATLVVSN